MRWNFVRYQEPSYVILLHYCVRTFSFTRTTCFDLSKVYFYRMTCSCWIVRESKSGWQVDRDFRDQIYIHTMKFLFNGVKVNMYRQEKTSK